MAKLRTCIVFSSYDPAEDPYLSWLIGSIANASIDVHVIAMGEAESEKKHSRAEFIFAGQARPGNGASDAHKMLTGLKPAGDPIFHRFERFQKLVSASEAAGGVSAASLSGYQWLFLSSCVTTTQTLLNASRGKKARADFVLATDFATLPAALTYARGTGARAVYAAQRFGPDSMLVEPRPRSLFFEAERRLLEDFDAVIVPTPGLKSQFETQYGDTVDVYTTLGATRDDQVLSALGEEDGGPLDTDFEFDEGGSRKPRLLVLCGHDPALNPRVNWTAETARDEGYQVRIVCRQDESEPHQASKPEDITTVRLKRSSPAISSAQMRSTLAKQGAWPGWLARLSTSAAVRNSTGRVLTAPWFAIAWLAQGIGVDAWTTRPLAQAAGAIWRANVDPLLPFKGRAASRRFIVERALAYARQVAFEVNRSGWIPTAVHAHDPVTLIAALLLRELYGAPVVYDANAFGAEANGLHAQSTKLFQAYEGMCLARIDGATTVSDEVALQFHARFGDRIRFATIPNASPVGRSRPDCDPAQFSAPAKDRMRFLYQGALDVDCGVDLLIRAWAGVDDSKAVLFIRGPRGDDREVFEKLARETGRLDKSIFFLDIESNSDDIAAARETDVGLIPFRTNSPTYGVASPHTLSHLMQGGAALISSPIPHSRAVIQTADCGEIVDDGDAEALTETIDRFANNPSLVREYGERGQSYAEHFYNFKAYSPVLVALWRREQPDPSQTTIALRQIAESKRVDPDPEKVEFARSLSDALNELPERAAEHFTFKSIDPAPPFEAFDEQQDAGGRRRRYTLKRGASLSETQLERSLVETLAPPNPGMKSVLFLHHAYYHFFYLARAMRERGMHAVSVSFESPDSANAKFYHGEDLNLYHPDPKVRKARAYDLMEAISEHFQVFHYHGAELSSLFEENYQPRARDRAPWDLLELKRRGVKIAHSMSGCNTGQRPSKLYRVSSGVCDKCIWQLHPDSCSDRVVAPVNTLLEHLLDLNAIELDWPADTSRLTPAAYYDPLTYCVDPEIWNPDLEVPEEMKFEREPGEILVFHAVGNFDTRAKSQRNIKGTGAVIAAVNRLKEQGYPVRLVFKTGVPSRDMRFYQVQADIIVDQLNYGRNGATARECLMLGLPVITRYVREQPNGVGPSRALRDIPVIDADESTIYPVLRSILEDPLQLDEVRRRSRQFALDWFSSAACAERYETVYDRLMAGEPVWRAGD